MLKNKFVKATLILLIGGFISKFMGFILKIIITRIIGVEGIGLYSLIIPTFSLFLTIAIFSFPISLSKLIAEEKRRSKNLIISIIPVSLLIDLFLLLLIFLIAPVLSNNLLKEPRLYYPILAIGLTLPFVGLSSIIKGYFWGKQNMGPYIISNIVEQTVRIIILVIILPKLIKINLVITISSIILVNIISELCSIIVMLLFLKRNELINIKNIKIDKNSIKDILDISIPSTSSKIVGSISYFFEPIILTNTLLSVGYSNTYIIKEYGILNGFALSLLMLPSFFSTSISTALISELSKNYYLKNYKQCKKRVKQIISLSLFIGIISTTMIFIFPNFLLKLLFNQVVGINYIKILAPFILLYFIDLPLIASLQAINKSKENMIITIIGCTIKLGLIFILSLLKIGLYGLVMAIIINLIIVTYLNYITLKKFLNPKLHHSF